MLGKGVPGRGNSKNDLVSSKTGREASKMRREDRRSPGREPGFRECSEHVSFLLHLR